jgi:hypothetical protein
VFPGLPNISSAGNPISLPNIIIYVKVRAKELKLGDLVYQLDTATVKGKTRKLSPSWKGPEVVIEKLTPYLYKIKLKRVIITANHDRLKLCPILPPLHYAFSRGCL